jgi:hypothetical protein
MHRNSYEKSHEKGSLWMDGGCRHDRDRAYIKRSGRKRVVRGRGSGFVGIALHKPRAAERTKLIQRERERDRENPGIDVMECKGEHVVVQFRGWYNTTSKPSQVSREGGIGGDGRCEVCVHINSIRKRENQKIKKVVCSGGNGDWGNGNWGLCQRPTSVDKTGGMRGNSMYETGQCSCPRRRWLRQISAFREYGVWAVCRTIWWWDPYR